ncbi:DUF4350 domain-containing protein [Actinomyces vulturis]|uniref:DUF4350 domain-containing protein n=1 Tax=Actinomyces vulturis TaxID=1857645 RepID=UPI00082BDDEE|nr:DUF4350 domain-containing protein [Actinomyces vulturis]
MKALKSRSFWIVLMVFLLAMGIVVMLHQPDSRVAYSPFNRHANGTMALSELLKDSDIEVSALSSFDDLDTAGDDVTVVVVQSASLDEKQIKHLSHAQHVVFLGTQWANLSDVTDALSASGTSAPSEQLLTAQCQWAPGIRAESLAGSLTSLTLSKDAVFHDGHWALPDGTTIDACFPLSTSQNSSSFSVAHVVTNEGRELTFIADGDIALNSHLAESGNAALLINALGERPKVKWFDAATPPPTSVWNSVSVPPFLPRMLFAFLLTVIVLAFALGRRFGPLVREPLPVEVKSIETTIGLGRLYEHSHDHVHAAQYLRSGSLHRMTKQLSSSSSLSNDDVVMLISSRTHRHPHEVHSLFFGPAPTTDRGLVDLAQQLDTIESEVHPL